MFSRSGIIVSHFSETAAMTSNSRPVPVRMASNLIKSKSFVACLFLGAIFLGTSAYSYVAFLYECPTICAATNRAIKSMPQSISDEEYRVYDAIIDEQKDTDASDAISISSTTLGTSESHCRCDCVCWIRAELELQKDFAEKNSYVSHLQDSFKTKRKYNFNAAPLSTEQKRIVEWEPSEPGQLFSFSRVGFDSTKSKAVVYYEIRSFAPHTRSFGAGSVMLLEKQSGNWKKISSRVIWIT